MSPIPVDGFNLRGIVGDGDGDDLLLLVFFDHTVPMVLSATQYLNDIVCGFRIDRNPGEHGDAFRYGGQMDKKRGCSIGFSNVINSTHHGLQILQDLHVDW